MTATGAALLSRSLLFLLIWWLLSDGETASLWIGVPAILLAVMISIRLLPATTFSWYQFLKFIPFFLLHSLRGGSDVAWRAFHPDLPIAPDLIDYPMQLPAGLPQVFMANTANLLPGTLSASLTGNLLKVHVLDRHQDMLAELAVIEIHVGKIFGMVLQMPEETRPDSMKT
ncbi:MAG: Na+/H+ antiporter subunit E [Gammaproteobacteria bacterium]|nr:Na+/H+ antiporter subunit E [Gammaproteobacteria bacterium]